MVAFGATPKTLITTYLEMTNPEKLESGIQSAHDVRVERMNSVDLGFYRYLYQSVGENYRWRDRLIMPNSELREILSSSKTHVYVLYVSGAPAGYVELHQEGNSTEVAYFGLRGEYHGRGLGKFLLNYGLQKAWELESTRRVWVHTCNLDGIHALENYKKRGFKIYQEEHEPMPELYQ